MNLARPLDRFWAVLIDGLIFSPLLLGMGLAAYMMKIGSLSSVLGMIGTMVLGLGMLALAGYQIYLLTTQGQTIGKRKMGLRIVRVKDLSNGGFVTNVLLRGVVRAVIGVIPFLGAIFTIADPLCIFRADRRCLHDHIAGTCVINADAVVQ